LGEGESGYLFFNLTHPHPGIDRAIIRLYRSLDLRHYLNETFQTKSSLFYTAAEDITKAYQSF
jgi:hypothetical protein